MGYCDTPVLRRISPDAPTHGLTHELTVLRVKVQVLMAGADAAAAAGKHWLAHDLGELAARALDDYRELLLAYDDAGGEG